MKLGCPATLSTASSMRYFLRAKMAGLRRARLGRLIRNGVLAVPATKAAMDRSSWLRVRTALPLSRSNPDRTRFALRLITLRC